MISPGDLVKIRFDKLPVTATGRLYLVYHHRGEDVGWKLGDEQDSWMTHQLDEDPRLVIASKELNRRTHLIMVGLPVGYVWINAAHVEKM